MNETITVILSFQESLFYIMIFGMIVVFGGLGIYHILKGEN